MNTTAIHRATRNANRWGQWAAAGYMANNGANPSQISAALNWARWLHKATIPRASK